MARRHVGLIVAAINIWYAISMGVNAQAIPPPPLKPCQDLAVMGKMNGVWESRRDNEHSGRFDISISLTCKAGGTKIDFTNLEIHPQELADTKLDKAVYGKSIDYVASIGQAVTPTALIGGKCGQPAGPPDPDCRFWLMFVDNQGKTSSLVAFLVSDGAGQRLAYGAGPIDQGGIDIYGAE